MGIVNGDVGKEEAGTGRIWEGGAGGFVHGGRKKMAKQLQRQRALGLTRASKVELEFVNRFAGYSNGAIPTHTRP